MRDAQRAARRRAWREAVQRLKASHEQLDRADYELIQQMRDAGLSWPAIGREFEERHWTAVYQRFQRLKRRFDQEQPTTDQPAPNDGSPSRQDQPDQRL
jgi:hypothetical protein